MVGRPEAGTLEWERDGMGDLMAVLKELGGLVGGAGQEEGV